MSSPFVMLLGAGASVPAGKPTIEQLTTGFSKHLEKSADRALIDAYKFVEKVIKEKERRFDVELALQALTELTEKPTSTIQYFHGDILQEALKYGSSFTEVKSRLKSYIRQECEDPGDLSYLTSLPIGFMDEKLGLDIFTLNYDPTIEALCDSQNISLTDGFDPTWNPSSFDDPRFSVRIYKIHGSVYWFLRSPGHYVKIPVKGSFKNMTYFTGEELSELVLYPVFEKRIDSGPYPFILNRFREKLGSSRLLVAIGYSFRDRNIRNLIIEQMRSNPELWLLLASPNADVRRADLYREGPDLAVRIVALKADAKTSIDKRRLNESVRTLANARVSEESARRYQATQSYIQDAQWIGCLREYLSLEHYPKLKEIGREILLSGNLAASGNFMIESLLSPYVLRFGLEDLIDKDPQDAAKWLDYFKTMCMVADDRLFVLYRDTFLTEFEREQFKKEIRLTQTHERPLWIRGGAGFDQQAFTVEVKRAAAEFESRDQGKQYKDTIPILASLASTVISCTLKRSHKKQRPNAAVGLLAI